MSKIVLILILLLGIVAAFHLWTIYRRSQDLYLDKLMTAHAKDAVSKAKIDFSIQLDYTPESITQVEKILDTIYNSYQQKPVDEITLGRESRLWGCYIGEVIKKIKDGKWQRDSAVAGKGALPLVFGVQDEVYPSAWVYKRLTNGDMDNVAYKYQVLIVERDKKYVDPNSPIHSEPIAKEK